MAKGFLLHSFLLVIFLALSSCSPASHNKEKNIKAQTTSSDEDIEHHIYTLENESLSAKVEGNKLASPEQLIEPFSEDDWQDDSILKNFEHEANDPLEKLNRILFNVHVGVDALTSRPAAKIYRKIVPSPGKKMIGNFLSNMWEPMRFIYGVISLDAKTASTAYARFFINTTLGAGGMFDAAKKWKDIERIPISGDKVLAKYGVPPGPYVFIPYLGPANMRGAIGHVADIFLDPFVYLIDDKYNYARVIVGYVDEREKNLDITDDIVKIAVDPYVMLRSLFRQHNKGNNQ